MRQPLLSHGVGGGVWRIKWHPTDPNRILIAGMHNGFFVLDLQGTGKGAEAEGYEGLRLETSVEYKKHESLAYGVDWCRSLQNMIVSCSFYDNLVTSWSIQKI